MPPGYNPLTVSFVDGQLYVGALPLFPLSEAKFQNFFGTSLEFSRDARGAVTGLTRAEMFYRKR
jgi:hypothetical protein